MGLEYVFDSADVCFTSRGKFMMSITRVGAEFAFLWGDQVLFMQHVSHSAVLMFSMKEYGPILVGTDIVAETVRKSLNATSNFFQDYNSRFIHKLNSQNLSHSLVCSQSMGVLKSKFFFHFSSQPLPDLSFSFAIEYLDLIS